MPSTGGTFAVRYTDEDGDLADDAGDEVLVTARGAFGGVTHEVEALVRPGLGVPLTCLFISAGTTPTTQEQRSIALIESFGFTVETRSASASQADLLAAADAANVVYIPESITSGNLNTKLTSTQRGIVNEETALVDEFGLARNSSSNFTSDRLEHHRDQPAGPVPRGQRRGHQQRID